MHYPSLAFQQPEVAVYFPAEGKPAHVVTTWNRNYKTVEGIGPCSTIEEMKQAYGSEVKPTWAGNNAGKQWSWVVGNNLLFATQDHKTIADVVLYKGNPKHTRSESPQAYANYVAAVETPCK